MSRVLLVCKVWLRMSCVSSILLVCNWFVMQSFSAESSFAGDWCALIIYKVRFGTLVCKVRLQLVAGVMLIYSGAGMLVPSGLQFHKAWLLWCLICCWSARRTCFDFWFATRQGAAVRLHSVLLVSRVWVCCWLISCLSARCDWPGALVCWAPARFCADTQNAECGRANVQRSVWLWQQATSSSMVCTGATYVIPQSWDDNTWAPPLTAYPLA